MNYYCGISDETERIDESLSLKLNSFMLTFIF